MNREIASQYAFIIEKITLQISKLLRSQDTMNTDFSAQGQSKVITQLQLYCFVNQRGYLCIYTVQNLQFQLLSAQNKFLSLWQ